MRWLRCLDCWQPAERSERFPGLWWWRAALRPMVKLRGGTWLTPWVCAKIGYPTSQQKWSIYQETIGLGGTTICAHTHMLTPRFPNEMLCGFPWIQLWCKHEHTRKLWTLFVTVYSKGSVQPCPAMSSLLFKYPPVISLCGMGHPLPLAILSGINGVALPGEEQHRSGGCLLLHAPTYSVLSAVLSKRQDDISCSSTRWFRVACRFGITSHGLISRGLDSKKISGTSISKWQWIIHEDMAPVPNTSKF